MTDTLKRIHPEEIAAAYKATGLIPTQCLWLWGRSDGKYKACGLTALYQSITGYSDCYDGWTMQYYLESLGYSMEYLHGFADGFDGRPSHPQPRPWQACGASSCSRGIPAICTTGTRGVVVGRIVTWRCRIIALAAPRNAAWSSDCGRITHFLTAIVMVEERYDSTDPLRGLPCAARAARSERLRALLSAQR